MSGNEVSTGLGVAAGIGVGFATGNPMLGMAAGGAMMQAGSSVSAGMSQADAAERNAYFKRLQAQELLERQKINEEIMKEQAEEAKHIYGSGSATSGLAGTGLGGKLKIHQRLQETLINTRREAEFKAKMLRAGADIETELASDMRSGAWLTGFGSLLGTGASIYRMERGPSSPKSLPEV
jgi:hypothetical protein